MNTRLGKCLAVFFAACFLAIQFNAVADVNTEHNSKQIFHVEEVDTSAINKGIDISVIAAQQSSSKQHYLSQQKTKRQQQRQFLTGIERHVEHAFRQVMFGSQSAIRQDYQDRLFTTFNYRQLLALSFNVNPILIPTIRQVHIDESDSNLLS
ncbi:hypothetical protein [uncultured Paraglaciecola sp.]|uniref:hypothetical protein n=1 Tax=uncultured Paraglaciecola sp. TaxID=1765024 RepID=UPI00261722A6|nr:hypothetical protein [uncultured Paraglaciecola sp.]